MLLMFSLVAHADPIVLISPNLKSKLERTNTVSANSTSLLMKVLGRNRKLKRFSGRGNITIEANRFSTIRSIENIALAQGLVIKRIGREKKYYPVGIAIEKRKKGYRITTSYEGCNKSRVCQITIKFAENKKLSKKNHIDKIKVISHPLNVPVSDSPESLPNYNHVHINPGFSTMNGGDLREIEMRFFTTPEYHQRWGQDSENLLLQYINHVDARIRTRLGATINVLSITFNPTTSPFTGGTDITANVNSLKSYISTYNIISDLNHIILGNYSSGPIGYALMTWLPFNSMSMVCHVQETGSNSGGSITYYSTIAGNASIIEHEMFHTLSAYNASTGGHDSEPTQYVMSPGATGNDREYSTASLNAWNSFLADNNYSSCLASVSEGTPTATPTPTTLPATATPTPTILPATATPTRTPTHTRTATPTNLPATSTSTPTNTPTSVSPTNSPTPSSSPTPTNSPTYTNSPIPTPTIHADPFEVRLKFSSLKRAGRIQIVRSNHLAKGLHAEIKIRTLAIQKKSFKNKSFVTFKDVMPSHRKVIITVFESNETGGKIRVFKESLPLKKRVRDLLKMNGLGT